MGKAGDVFMFDSSGTHSGNRSDGKTRDIFLVMYTADKSYVWNVDLPDEVFRKNASGNLKPFARILQSKAADPAKKLVPHYCSWTSSLRHPEVWV